VMRESEIAHYGHFDTEKGCLSIDNGVCLDKNVDIQYVSLVRPQGH